ncbi:pentapeptide repeat-containing protein [Paenarthrobacter histidinolovorans]|uniref:pentapeptide repeat-containing protein n=1 Tax=Paenarthrobacter histidinolovorans TaxID=43664 RepID=UPI00384F723F
MVYANLERANLARANLAGSNLAGSNLGWSKGQSKAAWPWLGLLVGDEGTSLGGNAAVRGQRRHKPCAVGPRAPHRWFKNPCGYLRRRPPSRGGQ